MTDPRTRNLARLLVNYCTRVQESDLVIILGRPFCAEALPFYREIFREVLRAGGHPYMMGDPLEEQMQAIFLSEASEAQLSYLNPLVEQAIRECDCYISVRGGSNTRRLANVDPQRMAAYLKGQSSLLKTRLQRAAEGQMRWVGTAYPTSGLAQDAEMSLEEYEDFVYAATYADTADPAREWEAIREQQQRWVDWLAGKKRVLLRGPDIDLSFNIEGRRFINSHGTTNMPSGEIYTSPLEDSANGWVRFSFPAVVRGTMLEGIELRFESGKVVEASARKGEGLLQAGLNIDAGARYVGELGIGTNWQIDRFTKLMLFDEKIGGTIHVALGSSYPQTGGKNQSSIHVDLICDMRDGGQLYVDDELIYESGEFLIG